MPELPEVEVSRQGLLPYLPGQRILDAIFRTQKLRHAIPAGLASRLTGLRVDGIHRRGKYLLFDCESKLDGGWPLGRAVNRLELWAEVARVPGVLKVNEVLLAGATGGAVDTEIPMRGLQLPRLAGLAVELGGALPLDDLRGTGSAAPAPAGPRIVPVPTVPTTC